MSIGGGLEAYLTRLWGSPVSVANLARIPGGASRETYRFDATVDGATRALILRREPSAGLIDTESATEYRAYQSAQGIVPVPAAVALEPGGTELDRPFFIMERVDGGVVASAFERDPFGAQGETLGEQFFSALGRLAASDPAGTPLAQHLDAPAPDECWRVALDYWESVIDADSFAPQPIVRAAIRRLRANPPLPAQVVRIVHGDYRSGNMMHDGAGTMLAMFDWEMAHLGDPLEDLGWALDPIWTHFVDGKVGGMCARDRAIATWEAASGLTVDSAALAWWSLFNSVKGRAIWTSAFREFVDGGRTDPVLGLSGWYTARRQDAIIAEQLGGDAPGLTQPTAQSELGHILTGAGLVAAGAGQAAAEHDAFGGSTILVAGLLALLAAQEAEKAATWRLTDIAAMRDVLGTAAPATGDGTTLPDLDATWATLSEALIESGRDDHAVLSFYRESAARRELTWPI